MLLGKNFWRGRRVLVTGGSGFVGSHLVKRLQAEGAVVTSLSRRDSGVDVADRRALEPFFQKKPSIVFHLAGEALVERGQGDPYETFKTNFMGTLNVLELSRLTRISRIIIASTSHVYGEGRPPFTEDDPPRPSRPYETSKTTTDLLAQSYADSFHLPVVIPRFVNIYGPADTNMARLIPKTISYVLRNQAVPVWGGSARREYLYVGDAVEAYLLLAAVPGSTVEKNRIYNFGTGTLVSVTELIRTIGKLAHSSGNVKHIRKGREGEIPEQYVSWEKARRLLGWKPNVSLEEGLRRTIAWYREHLYTTSL